MEDQAELIRQQMQEKRAELSEKLQELAGKLPTDTVAETVESVSHTVTDTAENVQETVHSFQEALDLPKQVQEHPWLAVGGAVLVGYLAHDVLLARDGHQSILAEPLKHLEEVAARTAVDLVTRSVKGSLLGPYGPILENILGQLAGGLKGLSSTQSSGERPHNGHGEAHGVMPFSPSSRQPVHRGP
jgi:ElaB/YqjD/DUF883 family membrane-anchored ribosome-binding protein